MGAFIYLTNSVTYVIFSLLNLFKQFIMANNGRSNGAALEGVASAVPMEAVKTGGTLEKGITGATGVPGEVVDSVRGGSTLKAILAINAGDLRDDIENATTLEGRMSVDAAKQRLDDLADVMKIAKAGAPVGAATVETTAVDEKKVSLLGQMKCVSFRTEVEKVAQDLSIKALGELLELDKLLRGLDAGFEEIDTMIKAVSANVPRHAATLSLKKTSTIETLLGNNAQSLWIAEQTRIIDRFVNQAELKKGHPKEEDDLRNKAVDLFAYMHETEAPSADARIPGHFFGSKFVSLADILGRVIELSNVQGSCDSSSSDKLEILIKRSPKLQAWLAHRDEKFVKVEDVQRACNTIPMGILETIPAVVLDSIIMLFRDAGMRSCFEKLSPKQWASFVMGTDHTASGLLLVLKESDAK